MSAWWIGIAALVEFAHKLAVLMIFRLGGRYVHGRSDLGERKQTGGRFAMKADATVGSRMWMNESFVEAVSRFKFTPVAHWVSGIRLADAAFVFDLVVNRETTGRCWRAGQSDTTLNGHQEAVAFLDVYVLRGSGDLHNHVVRVMRLESLYLVRARAGCGRRAGGKENSHRGREEK